MEQSIFDETLPWKKLPYFIQERIYWRPIVHARNNMGWKALHEQLFPFDYGKHQCWDCGNELTKMRRFEEHDLPVVKYIIDINIHSHFKFCCKKCKLFGRRKLYRVQHSHQGMFPRTDLPFYKIHVFGYLVVNIHRPSSNAYNGYLLTGYHMGYEINAVRKLTRYYDEDNDYTREHHIFKPIFCCPAFRVVFA